MDGWRRLILPGGLAAVGVICASTWFVMDALPHPSFEADPLGWMRFSRRQSLLEFGAVGAGTLGAIASAVPFFRIRRHRRRVDDGRCTHCGYDLRACVERCSECGETVPSPGAAETRSPS